jgi:hypothetical protein
MNKDLIKALERVSKEIGTKELKELSKLLGVRITKAKTPLPALPKLELVKEEWLGYSIEPYSWNGIDLYVRDVYTRNDEFRMVIVDESMRESDLIGNRTAFSRWDYTGYIELIIKKKPKVRNGLHSVALCTHGNYVDSKKWNKFAVKGYCNGFYHYEFGTSDCLNPNTLIGKITNDMEHCVNLLCESHNITLQKRNESNNK